MTPLPSERVTRNPMTSVPGFTSRMWSIRYHGPLIVRMLLTAIAVMLILAFVFVVSAWSLATWLLFPLPKLIWRIFYHRGRDRKVAAMRHREVMNH